MRRQCRGVWIRRRLLVVRTCKATHVAHAMRPLVPARTADPAHATLPVVVAVTVHPAAPAPAVQPVMLPVPRSTAAFAMAAAPAVPEETQPIHHFLPQDLGGKVTSGRGSEAWRLDCAGKSDATALSHGLCVRPFAACRVIPKRRRVRLAAAVQKARSMMNLVPATEASLSPDRDGGVAATDYSTTLWIRSSADTRRPPQLMYPSPPLPSDGSVNSNIRTSSRYQSGNRSVKRSTRMTV